MQGYTRFAREVDCRRNSAVRLLADGLDKQHLDPADWAHKAMARNECRQAAVAGTEHLLR